MTKNYYDELLEKIEDNIKNNHIDVAINLIEEELKLPYIPQIYEEKILKIYEKISNKKNENKSVFSKDEIIDIFLKYNNEHSNDFLFEVAQMMNVYSWNDCLEELQNIFNVQNLNNNVKATIYNIISIQNINHVFLIDNKKLNPARNLTIYETEFATKNFDDLSKSFFGEPTLVDIAKKALMIYLLNIFPTSVELEYKNITKHLINIAKVMLGQKNEGTLSNDEKDIYSIIKKY